MRVAKWGNSLAVRLPAKLVQELGVKEGDEVSLTIERASEVGDIRSWRVALAKLQELPKLFPADYRFKREDAYDED